jgi:phage baseplate assembly protein W
MPKIEFKNVGTAASEVLASRLSRPSLVPIGIKTPLEFGDHGLFRMHFGLVDQIKDNLKNLLLTNHGERLGLFDFGANLRSLLFDVTTADFDEKVAENIKTAVSKFMPFVSLETMEIKYDDKNNVETAIIKILITYSVPAAKAARQKIEVVLYAGG